MSGYEDEIVKKESVARQNTLTAEIRAVRGSPYDLSTELSIASQVLDQSESDSVQFLVSASLIPIHSNLDRLYLLDFSL
jgi:hypothetical protein